MDEIKRLRHSADEIDAAIDSLPDFSNIYNKSEVDALLNSKADTADIYEATERIENLEERLAALESK